MSSSLTLAEELLLLAYEPESGKPAVQGDHLDLGVAGAHLLELSFYDRLTLADKKLATVGTAPAGDPLLDPVLARIQAEQRPRRVDWWVKRLKGRSREPVLARLQDGGLVRRERHKVLGVFPVTRYPAEAVGAGLELRQRLTAVIRDGTTPGLRTGALLALAHACRMHGCFATGLGHKGTRQRMAEIAEGNWAGDAVRKAITEEINAGIVAAVAAGAVAAGGAGGG